MRIRRGEAMNRLFANPGRRCFAILVMTACIVGCDGKDGPAGGGGKGLQRAVENRVSPRCILNP